MTNTETPAAAPPKTAQERFDEKYITATQIAEEVGVSRPAVLRAKQRGFLPEPISVGDTVVTVWEREIIRKHLEAWKLTVGCRKQGGVNE
jgi:predicted DNA-binding transcriptional regulator AlpA